MAPSPEPQPQLDENTCKLFIDEKPYVFEKGRMDLPQQLSEETYLDVYKSQLFDCGTPYQSKSAPMVLMGSTI